MRMLLPESLPGHIVRSLRTMKFDIALTGETSLEALFRTSERERRILLIENRRIAAQAPQPESVHGIIALDAATRTAAGFSKWVLPHLSEATEIQFEGHLTLIRGTGSVEVTHIRYRNQSVQEKISIPRGSNERFLHSGTRGLAQLRAKGILLGGFTHTHKGYSVERHPARFHFLSMVIRGSLVFTTDPSAHRTLDEGCTFLIPSGTIGSYRAEDATEFLWLHIDAMSFGQDIIGELRHSNLFPLQDLVDYCQYFRAEVRQPGAYGDAALTHLAELIALCIERRVSALGMPRKLNASRERLNAALRELEENLTSRPSVNDLARLAGISTSRLYRESERLFGKSPGGLIEEIRIRQARELLLNSDYRLERIAEMTGYSDAFSFSRAFKRLNGTAPSTFRQRGG